MKWRDVLGTRHVEGTEGLVPAGHGKDEAAGVLEAVDGGNCVCVEARIAEINIGFESRRLGASGLGLRIEIRHFVLLNFDEFLIEFW